MAVSRRQRLAVVVERVDRDARRRTRVVADLHQRHHRAEALALAPRFCRVAHRLLPVGEEVHEPALGRPRLDRAGNRVGEHRALADDGVLKFARRHAGKHAFLDRDVANRAVVVNLAARPERAVDPLKDRVDLDAVLRQREPLADLPGGDVADLLEARATPLQRDRGGETPTRDPARRVHDLLPRRQHHHVLQQDARERHRADAEARLHADLHEVVDGVHHEVPLAEEEATAGHAGLHVAVQQRVGVSTRRSLGRTIRGAGERLGDSVARLSRDVQVRVEDRVLHELDVRAEAVGGELESVDVVEARLLANRPVDERVARLRVDPEPHARQRILTEAGRAERADENGDAACGLLVVDGRDVLEQRGDRLLAASLEDATGPRRHPGEVGDRLHEAHLVRRAVGARRVDCVPQRARQGHADVLFRAFGEAHDLVHGLHRDPPVLRLICGRLGKLLALGVEAVVGKSDPSVGAVDGVGEVHERLLLGLVQRRERALVHADHRAHRVVARRQHRAPIAATNVDRAREVARELLVAALVDRVTQQADGVADVLLDDALACVEGLADLGRQLAGTLLKRDIATDKRPSDSASRRAKRRLGARFALNRRDHLADGLNRRFLDDAPERTTALAEQVEIDSLLRRLLHLRAGRVLSLRLGEVAYRPLLLAEYLDGELDGDEVVRHLLTARLRGGQRVVELLLDVGELCLRQAAAHRLAGEKVEDLDLILCLADQLATQHLLQRRAGLLRHVGERTVERSADTVVDRHAHVRVRRQAVDAGRSVLEAVEGVGQRAVRRSPVRHIARERLSEEVFRLQNLGLVTGEVAELVADRDTARLQPRDDVVHVLRRKHVAAKNTTQTIENRACIRAFEQIDDRATVVEELGDARDLARGADCLEEGGRRSCVFYCLGCFGGPRWGGGSGLRHRGFWRRVGKHHPTSRFQLVGRKVHESLSALNKRRQRRLVAGREAQQTRHALDELRPRALGALDLDGLEQRLELRIRQTVRDQLRRLVDHPRKIILTEPHQLTAWGEGSTNHG